MSFSSQVVSVLRYSSLGCGIIYGFYHQGRLSSYSKVHLAQTEWKQKEALITQAKEEWAKVHPVGVVTLITDPDDYRFDLEKFLLYMAGQDTANA
ncbi:ATP synthase E chain-domain-containing protein [Trichophaea hybrida]|nr:ATP synthase E chain-domain-containing protein [Trichophaea hybrida]